MCAHKIHAFKSVFYFVAIRYIEIVYSYNTINKSLSYSTYKY